ncbi:MAG TPA: hypothetical protein VNI58_03870 [Mariprofundaceae bacterium]|nr:hypothetical protein [Mariprofundaceae bacterium]
MNPENLSAEALRLFNRLPPEGQRQAMRLAESLSEEEAVYLAALRTMPEKQRRQFLFTLSKKKWGL